MTDFSAQHVEIEDFQMVEVDRTRYTGAGAMDKHSTRTYEYREATYCLDRDLSTNPPCYELAKLSPHKSNKPHRIIFDYEGWQFWGCGLSWPKAQVQAQNMIDSDQLKKR